MHPLQSPMMNIEELPDRTDKEKRAKFDTYILILNHLITVNILYDTIKGATHMVLPHPMVLVS